MFQLGSAVFAAAFLAAGCGSTKEDRGISGEDIGAGEDRGVLVVVERDPRRQERGVVERCNRLFG